MILYVSSARALGYLPKEGDYANKKIIIPGENRRNL